MILTKLIQIINDVEAVAVNTFQNILMVRFLIIRHDVNMVTNGEMHCAVHSTNTQGRSEKTSGPDLETRMYRFLSRDLVTPNKLQRVRRLQKC